jgi:rhomboid protease GluP
LANCRQCGTELPSFSFGDASPYCKTCQSQLPPVPRPEATYALPVQTAVVSQPPPVATYILLGVNIAIFIAMLVAGLDWFNPATDKVLRWGADYGPLTLNGQYWRIITAMFLHFGIIHIAANMWCLWSLGQLAEKLVGSFTVFGVYLVTGIGSSLLSLSWDPMRVSAGASGAIFGIAGMLISVLYFGKLGFPPENVRKLLGYVVRFALLNLFIGLQGHIDNMAHLGGLVTGLLAGFFLARTFNLPLEERPARRRMILAVSAVVLVALFVPVAKAKQFAVEFGQGQIALDHNDMNAAIAHFQKYVVARPDDVYGHLLLGDAYQQAHRLDEAIPEFERVLALKPDFPEAQINLARIYAYQKKPEKALPLFSAMLRVKPDALDYYWYATALKQANKLTEAERNIRSAIQMEPRDAESHKLLAEILELRGNKSEAALEIRTSEEIEHNVTTTPAVTYPLK